MSTVYLERARADIERLESLNINLTHQIDVYRQLREKDSLSLALKENRLELQYERLNARDEYITQLEKRLKARERRRWVWFGSGAGLITLSAVVLNLATP